MRTNEKDNDIFVFATENEKNIQSFNDAESWKILIVDDDEDVHDIIHISLREFSFLQKKISIYDAFSAKEAKTIISEHDVDLILLDVVMETNDAGLKLVKYIREELKNDLIRIVICTGQPWLVSERTIIINYDINEYKSKAELTSLSLQTSIITSLRTLTSLRKIETLQNESRKLAESASRFVPYTFIKLLNKDNITDVQLGDKIEKELTVLFLDIRSFTKLSEFLTPLEVFQLINSCMGYVGTVIDKNNGFIDKYIGDSLLALFVNANDAVRAGFQMLKTIEGYNSFRLSKNQMPIQVGIGINTGTVVIGTVGFQTRIECTVISDVVNVAARVEKMNKEMGCNLLITENTFNTLKDATQFNYRYLGQHALAGKKIALGIYEIFDGDRVDTIYLKQKTKNIFNLAIKFYDENNLNKAQEYFNKIKQLNSHDSVTRAFLEKIKPSE